ncbi:MAG: STAS domain-containing protein [Gammaproteobacteria bacterium]|nr:STAS domain-containing protein [Gammaproteobacteria bacterium]MBK8133786.1 STAS domain-containing protein [Gammaproteobacteria bacterium]MBK9426601.1 STAS domain-containing protein [Gammaproteobacteria bacterium]
MTSLPDGGGGSLQLSGDLTAREVPRIYAESLAWRVAGAVPAVVGLAAVTRADSSALALLLEWQAWAHSRNTVIKFVDPPRALRTFANLSEVSVLLGWPEEAFSH